LLASETAAPGLESLLKMHWSNGYWIIDDRYERQTSDLGEAASFCRQPQIYGPVVETLSQYWDENWQPGIVLVHGPRFSGKRHNLAYAAEQIANFDGRPLYIELYSGVRRRSVISPLVNSLRGWDLGEVPGDLTALERPSWEERVGLLDLLLDRQEISYCPDSIQRDFLLAYGLFVQSFVRRMGDRLLPAIMVCDDSHAYATETLEILSGLFERFLPTHLFLPVLVSQKPYLPPELRDFPYRKLRIPSAEEPVTGELSRRYLEGSPGGVRSPDWIRERTGGNIAAMFHLFHLLQRTGEEGPVEGIPAEIMTLFRIASGLGTNEKTVLYAAMLSWELLPTSRIVEMVAMFDIAAARIPEIIKLLCGVNLLRSDTTLQPTVPELEQYADRLPDFDAAAVRNAVAAHLYELWSSRVIPNSEVLFRVCMGSLEPRRERDVFRSLVSDLLDRKELSEAYRLLYTECPYADPSGSADPSELAVVLGLRLRLGLLASDRRGADAAFEESARIDADSISGSEAADLYLQRARYLFAGGELSRSLSLIKEAIIIYQNESDARGLTAAHSDFGVLMMAQEQLLEARDYFVIAGKNVEPEDSAHEYVRSDSLEMASQFIFGRFTRVIERLDKVGPVADRAGMREWGLYHRLVRGRVLFELGLYEEARLHFERSLTDAQVAHHSAAHRIYYAWLARTHAFDGSARRATEMLRGLPTTRETLLFQAEAAIFDESCGAAVALLEEASELPADENARSTESLVWLSGFSDLEDLTVGRAGSGGVVDHLIKAYHGYALAQVGHRIEGIAEMHRLTREERVSALDPYNHLYYLLYASILPDARDERRDPSLEDRLTVLGKAVKNMQERLSRIDRYEEKIAYQRRSRWNGLLFSEARTHNLL
ncbi:hypothetical protein, partial [Salinispira pacifica]